MNFIPNERATPIRMPSTANLMIDSVDRADTDVSPFNFQITRNYSIMNGFFTRIGATEVVLEWCEENINSALGNTLVLDLSGTGGNTYSGTQSISILASTYTVAQALDAIVIKLNDLSGTTGITFAITNTLSEGNYLTATGGFFDVQDGDLQGRLDLNSYAGLGPDASISCPDLRPYRYIDFVSSQLTYNQDLKDNSTNNNTRDVIVRWYFCYDEQNLLDKYGFPILMGYTQFATRRLYNPPKQIKWSNNQPLGNIAFQVYDELGNLLPVTSFHSNWLMTLQFSEV